MNEPMVLAEDLNIDIAYQDTDSMHVPRRRVFGHGAAVGQPVELRRGPPDRDRHHRYRGRYRSGAGVQLNLRATGTRALVSRV